MSDAEKAWAALAKIDAIRNSIIGCQTVNWSEHIYPLVAALKEAGFEGEPYEVARANVGTLLDRNTALEETIARQARTIRRLFTAYYLAKAKMRRAVRACVENAKWGHQHELDGAAKERARIVTALRDLDLISEYGAVPSLLADAIERGDL